MYKRFKVAVYIPSLMMHNGRLANPLDEATQALAKVTGINKKTEADHRKISDLEYVGSLYLNKREEVIIPSEVFEAVICAGARKSKEGKISLASVFVDTAAVITYDGGPMSVQELVKSPTHRDMSGVRLQGKRIIRTRPHFHEVYATFEVSLNVELANPEALKKWIEAALQQVGIGDWRPRHGRGELRAFEEIKAPVSAVA